MNSEFGDLYGWSSNVGKWDHEPPNIEKMPI